MRSCFVTSCSTHSCKESVSFFRIPSIRNKRKKSCRTRKEKKRDKEIRELSKKRQNAWISALKRGRLSATQLKNARICQKHFMSGRPADMADEANPDWAPCQNLGYDAGLALKDESAMKRHQRHQKRMKKEEISVIQNESGNVSSEMNDVEVEETVPQFDSTVDMDPDDIHVHQVFVDNEYDVEDNSVTNSAMEINLAEFRNGEIFTLSEALDEIKSLKEKLSLAHGEIGILRKKVQEFDLTEESFINDNQKTKYFTGLDNSQVLILIHETIAPNLYNRSNTALSTFQQLLITLLKLRLNLPFKYLAYRFNVAPSTISRYFRRCLYVLYTTFKTLIHWPDRNTLHATMPHCFKESFGNKVAVIIDCFEVYIEKPSNLYSCAQCWSNYKHHSTIKILIGITPQGTVSFISEAYGGRASDKFVTENSEFANFLLPGDFVFADRGFTIDDVVQMTGAELKIPCFTKGKNQLHPKELEETRNIAHVRIHVERVIGSVRQKYTILSGIVPISMLCPEEDSVSMFDEIVLVCCALLNLCPSMVSDV